MKLTKEAEQELAGIASGGVLDPHEVVLRARDPKSRLHSYFEWNDRAAGDAHRLEQARELIRSVRFVVTRKYEEMRVIAPTYVPGPKSKEGEAGYVSLRQLRPVQVKEVLEEEIKQILARFDRTIAMAVDREGQLPSGLVPALRLWREGSEAVLGELKACRSLVKVGR